MEPSRAFLSLLHPSSIFQTSAAEGRTIFYSLVVRCQIPKDPIFCVNLRPDNNTDNNSSV